MAKRHRSFSVKKREDLPEDQKITFDLGDETFTCKDELQGAIILDFVAAADAGATSAAAKIMGFFESALPEKEHERFMKIVYSDDVIVEMETLSEIIAFLIEEYANRPTEESE